MDITLENNASNESSDSTTLTQTVGQGSEAPYRIDPYLSSRLPPMPAACFAALKANISAEGRIRNPLVVWKETSLLLDGHHRDKARQELHAEGRTVPAPEFLSLSFADEAEAVCWVIRNQDGTRPQWSTWDKLKLLRADQRLMDGLKAHAKVKQANAESPKSDEPSADVMGVMAEMLGVARSTVHRLLTVLEDAALTAAVDNGQVSANQAYEQIAAGKRAKKTPKEVQKDEPNEAQLLDVLSRPEIARRIETGMYTPAHGVKSLANSKEAHRVTVKALAVKALPSYEPEGLVNAVTCCDALEGLKALKAESVDLTVTSPPYPLAHPFYRHWDYAALFGCDYRKYLAWMEGHFGEIYRVTKDGGQFCVNIDNCYDAKQKHNGLRVRNNCYADFCASAQKVGFRFSDSYVWVKQNAISNRVLMGGKRHVRSQSNCEHVIVFYKGNPTLDESLDDLTASKRHKLSIQAWYIKPVTSKKKPKGTAPFPLKLPARLIRLYSQRTQVVLDPFSGSGTTCAAAALLGRQFVGFDKDQKLVDRSMRRITKAIEKAKAKAAESITVEQVIQETGRRNVTKHYLGPSEYVNLMNAEVTAEDVQEIIRSVVGPGKSKDSAIIR